MAYDDVVEMLERAEPGMSLATWRANAAETTRLLRGDRRTTQLRIATAVLRPVGAAIPDDGFLTDLRAGDDAARRHLIYARYLASTPLAVATARNLFAPAMQAGRTSIQRSAVEAAIAASLPNASIATRNRSRTALVTEFGRAGVVRALRSGELELTGNRPALLAIYHLVHDELRDRREASDTWLATSSLAAALFGLAPKVVREYLAVLVENGRLQRSYYSGEPRILAA